MNNAKKGKINHNSWLRWALSFDALQTLKISFKCIFQNWRFFFHEHYFKYCAGRILSWLILSLSGSPVYFRKIPTNVVGKPRRMMRRSPPQHVSRDERERLVNMATKLIVATVRIKAIYMYHTLLKFWIKWRFVLYNLCSSMF